MPVGNTDVRGNTDVTDNMRSLEEPSVVQIGIHGLYQKSQPPISETL